MSVKIYESFINIVLQKYSMATKGDILRVLNDKLGGAKFALVPPNSKRCLAPNWTTTNNFYAYESDLEKHIETGGNYCVVTGYDNICVVDFDHPDIDALAAEMPFFQNTFTVRSATKRLKHVYFKIKGEEGSSFKWLDDQSQTLLDVQYTGRNVIGYGSTINGNEYSLECDADVKWVEFDELVESLATLFRKHPEYKCTLSADNAPKVKKADNEEIAEIRRCVKIVDLLKEAGVNTKGKKNTDCPFHSSQGGACFSYTDDKFNCFHCDRKGDIFTLYGELYDKPFKEVVGILATRAGLVATSLSPTTSSLSKNPYDNLGVKHFTIYKSGDESEYEIEFETCSIFLEQVDLLKPNVFRTKYFSEMHIMLPAINAKVWVSLINKWVTDYLVVRAESKVYNSNLNYIALILEEIVQGRAVRDPSIALNMNKFYYDPVEPDYIMVSNRVLLHILNKNRLPFKLQKMSILLKDYIDGSKVIRCGETTQRFTKFNVDMLDGLNKEELEKLYDEK